MKRVLMLAGDYTEDYDGAVSGITDGGGGGGCGLPGQDCGRHHKDSDS